DPAAGREVPAPVLLDRAVRAVHRGRQAPLPDPPGRRPLQAPARELGRGGPREAGQDRPLRDRWPGVVAFDQAFHGRTLLAMTLTSKAMPYKKGFGPYAPEVYRAPGPYPYRGISGDDAIAGVKKLFKSQIDPSAVAAIIYEPVQGEGGFLPAPEG